MHGMMLQLCLYLTSGCTITSNGKGTDHGKYDINLIYIITNQPSSEKNL